MNDVINGVPRELLKRISDFMAENVSHETQEEEELRAPLTAQESSFEDKPQASADDPRKLSDLGNELHNLSCEVVHSNEEWAEQIGKIACELWKWPQASTGQEASGHESDNKDRK